VLLGFIIVNDIVTENEQWR